MARPKAPCGTMSAYRRHMRDGEPVDDACRAAQRKQTSGRRASATANPVPNVAAVADDDLEYARKILRESLEKVSILAPDRVAPIAKALMDVSARIQANAAPAAKSEEASQDDEMAAARARRKARRQTETEGPDSATEG